MRRALRILIPLAIVAGLLLILDRGSVAVAQRVSASRLGDYAQFQKKPTVRIHGFPFLTQVFSGSLDDVEVRSDSVSVGSVTDAKFDVHLRGASLPLSKLIGGKIASLPVDKVNGDVVLTYADLSRLSTVTGLTFARNGDFLQISGRPTVPGIGAVGAVNATAAVSVLSGGLRARITSLQIGGAAVTGTTLSVVSGLLASAIVIPPLPYGLKLDSVQLTEAGLRVIGSGTKVTLTAP